MAGIGVNIVTSEKYKRKWKKKYPASILIIFHYKNYFSLPPDNSCDRQIIFLLQKWDITCLVNGRDWGKYGDVREIQKKTEEKISGFHFNNISLQKFFFSPKTILATVK